MDKKTNTSSNNRIKFRAWDRIHKRMCPVKNIIWSTFPGPKVKVFSRDSYWLRGDEFVLLQLTGVLDKNGEEICEGDILKNLDGHTQVIEWCEGRHGQYVSGFVLDLNTESCMVIGNIYENPELLNG